MGSGCHLPIVAGIATGESRYRDPDDLRGVYESGAREMRPALASEEARIVGRAKGGRA